VADGSGNRLEHLQRLGGDSDIGGDKFHYVISFAPTPAPLVWPVRPSR
jgi:hypothetical protein